VERILDSSVLDNDLDNFRAIQRIIQTTAPWAVAWVGEAGGAYNSGKHLVSNAFVMSFWLVQTFFHFSTKIQSKNKVI
jgi:heparanase 1